MQTPLYPPAPAGTRDGAGLAGRGVGCSEYTQARTRNEISFLHKYKLRLTIRLNTNTYEKALVFMNAVFVRNHKLHHTLVFPQEKVYTLVNTMTENVI